MSDSTSFSQRPVVFVGSSSGKGLPIAKALQVNLDHEAEVVLWSQGIFGLSMGTLEDLVNHLPYFDFAILVLTPDDMTASRDAASPSPRDNVIFELGLFMGSLGRCRTFIVHERNAPLKLPSDLAGITAATFQQHASGNLTSALGACCTLIEEAMRKLGIRNPEKLGNKNSEKPANYNLTPETSIPAVSNREAEVLKFIDWVMLPVAVGMAAEHFGMRKDQAEAYLKKLESKGLVRPRTQAGALHFSTTELGRKYLIDHDLV